MPLAISHIVPVRSENRWSDLLAVLVETDPERVSDLLGLPRGAAVRVRREVKGGGDRIDLLIYANDVLTTVVEVKVLAGFGAAQLARYHEAYPDAAHHVVVFPGRLAIDMRTHSHWIGVAWDEILGAFATSPDPWVAETARNWLRHLDAAIPSVDGATQWNDLQEGEDFVIALRARMSWVFEQLHPPAPLERDLVGSSAGVSWVARIWAEAAKQGYWVLVEAEEKLNVRAYPKTVTATSPRPLGPTVRLFLEQTDVTTSAGFDWDYLHALWPLMEAAPIDWVRNTPGLRAPHDRAGWQRIVDKGAPRFLGIGYGEAQTKRSSSCMFGARFQLPPDVTLGELVTALENTSSLVLDMSRQPPP